MPLPLSESEFHEARARIRTVAKRQFAERCIEATSMRSIAGELGWSATALYRYFDNKDGLLAATRAAALDRLSAALEAATSGPGDVWERSRAVGQAYTDFAFRELANYRLMFALQQSDAGQYPRLGAGQRALPAHDDGLRRYAGQCRRAGTRSGAAGPGVLGCAARRGGTADGRQAQPRFFPVRGDSERSRAADHARRLQDLSATALEIEGLDELYPNEASDEIARFQNGYFRAAVMRIAGSADEVLRNQLAERVLGLPGDLRVDNDVAFSALPSGR